MTTSQSKAPNIERLLNYIRKSSWRHVSPNFTGFVKKEFEALLEKLDEDDIAYPNLTKLVREAELGRFTNTKDLCEPSLSELQEIERKLKYQEHEKVLCAYKGVCLNDQHSDANTYLTRD